MAAFITLTQVDGERMSINVDHLVSYTVNKDGGTYVSASAPALCFYVTETVAEIEKILRSVLGVKMNVWTKKKNIAGKVA